MSEKFAVRNVRLCAKDCLCLLRDPCHSTAVAEQLRDVVTRILGREVALTVTVEPHDKLVVGALVKLVVNLVLNVLKSCHFGILEVLVRSGAGGELTGEGQIAAILSSKRQLFVLGNGEAQNCG